MPKQKAKLTKDQVVMLEKLSIKMDVLGQEYRFIPVWFRKAGKDIYEIMPLDKLPPEVIAELNANKQVLDNKEQRIITREGPVTEQELKSHIIKPFRS